MTLAEFLKSEGIEDNLPHNNIDTFIKHAREAGFDANYWNIVSCVASWVAVGFVESAEEQKVAEFMWYYSEGDTTRAGTILSCKIVDSYDITNPADVIPCLWNRRIVEAMRIAIETGPLIF